MKTLFLNPNSSDEITSIMRRQIGAQGLTSDSYEVSNLKDAPKIIASEKDNKISQELIEKNFKTLTSGFTRLVLMSSLDTGFEYARSVGSIEVHGFTRSILERYKYIGKNLKTITFDNSMTSLYREIFESHSYDGVVQSMNVLPLAPSDVGNKKNNVINTLQELCWKLSQDSDVPIFIVGVVGLQLGEELRQDGLKLVIDPIADLIEHLNFIK